MKISRRLLLAVSLLIPSASFGGGSVTWKEVQVVLDQRPEIAQLVYSALDCFHSGYAPMRIGGRFPLGGRRLGPYEFRCRPKDTKGNYDLLMTVDTTYKLYDDKRKQVGLEKATQVEEQFESIKLTYKPCEENWCKAP